MTLGSTEKDIGEKANFPFEELLLQLKEGEEEIIYINGRSFLVTLATQDDIERIDKGFFVMD